MSSENSAERTEQPTPRRRQEARREGKVARSPEVSAALTMFMLAAVTLWWLTAILPGLISFARGSFGIEQWREMPTVVAAEMIRSAGHEVARIFLPVAIVGLVIGVAANLGQVGLMFNFELISLKWDRLNPANWLKNMASLSLVVGIAKSIFKGLGIVALAGYGLRELPLSAWRIAFGDLAALGRQMQGAAFSVFWRVSIALAVLAAADLLWNKYRHEKQLRMTKQELKDELKEMSGNPHLKAAMRRRARDMINEALAHNVRNATVVVTNPTHFAVALRYRRKEDAGPRVVAKGRGYKALRVRELAAQFGVPIVEDRPLARALYSSVKVGREIPVGLYRAVARLLAIVYRRQGVQAGALS